MAQNEAAIRRQRRRKRGSRVKITGSTEEAQREASQRQVDTLREIIAEAKIVAEEIRRIRAANA